MSSPRVIQVAVPRPLHGVYDYAVPSALTAPAVGCRVRVPFGRASAIAVCTSVSVSNPHHELKDVIEVLDTDPILDTASLDLATWMTRYYHHPLGEVLATVLPAAARKGARADLEPADHWQLTGLAFENKRAHARQAAYDQLAAHGPASGTSLTAAGHARRVIRPTGRKRAHRALRARPGAGNCPAAHAKRGPSRRHRRDHTRRYRICTFFAGRCHRKR